MQKLKKLIIVSICLLAITCSSTAFAVVFGGSNLGIGGYPKHDCYAPRRPYDMGDEYAVSRYKSDINTYLDCIREYVGNAKKDIDRITEQANDAIEEANSQHW